MFFNSIFLQNSLKNNIIKQKKSMFNQFMQLPTTKRLDHSVGRIFETMWFPHSKLATKKKINHVYISPHTHLLQSRILWSNGNLG